MRRERILAVLGTAALLCALARPAMSADAQTGYPAELLPIEQARRAIDDSPEVRSALSMRTAALAGRRGLAAGTQEWSARVDHLRRRSRDPSGVDRFADWEFSLERPLRSGTKAQLDRRLGDARLAEADVAVADARHETGRQLLALWYGWLREQSAAALLREAADLVAREAGIVARRQRLGDSSALDEIQARAAAAQVEANARLAAERAERAQIALHTRFPGVTLSAPARDHDPQPAPADAARLAQAVVDEDHGLKLARAAAERAMIESQRVLSQLRPDPTVGLRMAREHDGSGSTIGVFLSVPFPGEARRAESDASAAVAAALLRQAEGTAARLRAEALSLTYAVGSSYARWESSRAAAELQARAAARVAVAHGLGEVGLSEALLARRLAIDAALTDSSARIDALENRARLLLDAHQIWDFDDPSSEN